MSDAATVANIAAEAGGAASGGDAQRIAVNFVRLAAQAWEFGVVGDVAWSVFVWGALLTLGGAVGGYVLWRVAVRQRARAAIGAGLIVGLVMPVVFIAFAAAGLGYGGLWLGGGRAARSYIVDHRAIERVVVFGIGAVALDEAGVTLSGNESPTDLDALFAESDRVRTLSAAEFDARVGRLLADAAASDAGLFDRWVRSVAAKLVGNRIVEDVLNQTGLDARVLVLMFTDPAAIERLELERPAITARIALVGEMLGRLSKGAMKLVHGVVYTNLAIGAAIGLLVPYLIATLAVRAAANRGVDPSKTPTRDGSAI